MKPSKHKMTVLSQIFKLIPRNLIPKLANDFGIDRLKFLFPLLHQIRMNLILTGDLRHGQVATQRFKRYATLEFAVVRFFHKTAFPVLIYRPFYTDSSCPVFGGNRTESISRVPGLCPVIRIIPVDGGANAHPTNVFGVSAGDLRIAIASYS